MLEFQQSEAKKLETIEDLKTPEGRREFTGIFEKILEGYRNFIRIGGDFVIQSCVVDDMGKLIDRIKEELPDDVVKFLSEARQQVIDLLKKEKERKDRIGKEIEKEERKAREKKKGEKRE